MRCFVGVPVSGKLAAECKSLSLGLPRAAPKANLHLTLAFLGQLSEPRIAALSAALEAHCSAEQGFTLEFRRCESFPDPGNGPFWALTCEASEALSRLHRGIWECLQTQGVEPETRPFRPHITLARPGQGLACQSGLWPLEVSQVWLYHSEAVQGGPPSYRPLAEYFLRTDAKT